MRPVHRPRQFVINPANKITDNPAGAEVHMVLDYVAASLITVAP